MQAGEAGVEQEEDTADKHRAVAVCQVWLTSKAGDEAVALSKAGGEAVAVLTGDTPSLLT